jgi:capsular polysaccharide biosynthesis protein
VRSTFYHEIKPQYSFISGAIVTQTEFSTKTNTYSGAAYDSSGSLVIDSIRLGLPNFTFRPNMPLSIEQDFRPPNAKRFQQAIYGGHFFYAWGHFLIETLSTAVISDGLPENIPVIFQPFELTTKNTWVESFENHVMPILRASGWGSREIIISSDPFFAGVLYVPQRQTAFGIGKPSIHPSMAAVFERIRAAFGCPNSGRMLVAMRNSSHRRWHQDETDIYEKLLSIGFEQIYPDNLSAIEQVKLFSSAKILVGFSGSTLHNSIFMHRGSKIIELLDGSTSSTGTTQTELCEICAQKMIQIPNVENLEDKINLILNAISGE